MKPETSKLEVLRKGFIRWNIAPLAVVGVLVYVLLDGMNIYKNAACTLPEWQVMALFPFLLSIAGLLYKVYDSMQKDRHEEKETKEEE